MDPHCLTASFGSWYVHAYPPAGAISSSFCLPVQILQEQQALLLEDSPAYLAALSQDDKGSCLSKAADAHDWALAHEPSTASEALEAWRPDQASNPNIQYSR